MAFSEYAKYNGLGLAELVRKKTISLWTPVFNLTGQPTMSVGMYFVGKWGDEATLLRLAGQLEKEKPWFDKAPAGY